MPNYKRVDKYQRTTVSPNGMSQARSSSYSKEEKLADLARRSREQLHLSKTSKTPTSLNGPFLQFFLVAVPNIPAYIALYDHGELRLCAIVALILLLFAYCLIYRSSIRQLLYSLIRWPNIKQPFLTKRLALLLAILLVELLGSSASAVYLAKKVSHYQHHEHQRPPSNSSNLIDIALHKMRI